jgi:hypothetical protein
MGGIDSQRKKELKESFKEVKTYYGVVRFTNTVTGRSFITSFSNLKNKEQYLHMQLDDGRYPNAALQADWRVYGGDSFSYEVLESKDAAKVTDARYAAKQLETLYRSEGDY